MNISLNALPSTAPQCQPNCRTQFKRHVSSVMGGMMAAMCCVPRPPPLCAARMGRALTPSEGSAHSGCLGPPTATMNLLIAAQAVSGELRHAAGSDDAAASAAVGLQASQLFDCLTYLPDGSAEDAEAWG